VWSDHAARRTLAGGAEVSYDRGVSPGGHLVTTAVASVSVVALTGSPALAAGVALGGFFIDVDHAVDYVLFDRQRDLRPAAFLRYYMEGRARWAVLVLHSYELLALQAALAWMLESVLGLGYVLGALMHVALDIRYNGELTPRSIVAFYSFAYRLAHRFDTRALLAYAGPPVAWTGFWSTFFVSLRRRGARTRGPALTAPETRA